MKVFSPQRSLVSVIVCAIVNLLCYGGWVVTAQGQQPQTPRRIGFLGATSASTIATRLDAFRQGLRELGYVEGKNIVIEYRYAEGKLDRVKDLAVELARLKVELIVSGGSAILNRRNR